MSHPIPELPDLTLERYPATADPELKAFDAADEYVLAHLRADAPIAEDAVVVVLNDRWGALATALAGCRPVSISDSYLSQLATRRNLTRNGVPDGTVTESDGLGELPERIDVAVIRVTRSLALLQDQLHRLAPHLHAGSTVVGTGPVTDIHTSTLQLFTDIIGPTRTSLARRKARLIFATPDPELDRSGARPANPWPKTMVLPADAGSLAGRAIVHHAGVFAADHLDVGTRLLLANLGTGRGPRVVCDLGSGNGVLGIAAALADPAADVVFTDESYRAIASARDSFTANLPGRDATFLVADVLATTDARPGPVLAPGSVQSVLNNPPFHLHRATTDDTAWRMFADARRALAAGGELRVVSNRHLNYHIKLKRLFGNASVVGSNAKFVVLRSVRAAR